LEPIVMLVIKHLNGPLRGKEDRIDPALDKVVFGRKTGCLIVYPPDETIIAREHFALVRKPPGPAGHWTIELFGEPFVAVDGIAADPGQKVPREAIFELGKKGGPSFELRVEADAAADNLPLTDTQSNPPRPRAMAAFSRRIAFLGLAAAIAVGAGGAYYYSRTAEFQIGGDVRERLKRAAFLVDAPAPVGTAFPVGPHLLATNSHVAELFEQLQPGQKMVVRSPGKNGKPYEVTGHKLHPGYRALTAFMEQDVLRQSAAKLAVPGYDVALLEVKEDLPADSILELAGSGELQALAPGAAVATAGYPMEGVLGSPAQSYGATPEIHVGTVTGLTDFFFLPADFAKAQLVHDDLPAAGGASGSPIAGRTGHVIALLNAGNSYNPGEHRARVPSGVLVNYGQRADLLRSLLDGSAEDEVAQDKAYWAEKYATFPSGQDVAPIWVTLNIQDDEKNDEIKLVRLSEDTFNLSRATRVNDGKRGFQRQADHSVAVSGGSEYVFLAYAFDGSPVQLWVYRGNEPIVHHAGDTFLPFLPFVRYEAAQDANLDAWVIGPKDNDVKYSFQVLKLVRPVKAK
jgi:Trypsin-like peptidase domain